MPLAAILTSLSPHQAPTVTPPLVILLRNETIQTAGPSEPLVLVARG